MPDLQKFEERSADHLRLVLENSQIGIWELDLGSGLAVRNEQHDRIFGYENPLPEWSYDRFLEHVVKSDRQRVDDLQKAAIEKGVEWSFECQIRTVDGHYRWIRAAGRPLHAADGSVDRLIGHVIDITDTKQAEARLRLITEELNHRVRNMLTMIRSMVRMTARSAADVAGFVQALDGRVGALARTQNRAVSTASSAMMPSAIFKAEAEAFEGFDKQVELEVAGEAELSATASQGLALVLHELFTNAIKHGALSAEAGRVHVCISTAEEEVQVLWRESGGPVVEKERGSGFGSLLISRALGADGTAEQIFTPTGLECCITLPVD